MANYHLRQVARNLRKQGVSVKVIAKECGIARSTASIWVRDIIGNYELAGILEEAVYRTQMQRYTSDHIEMLEHAAL